ncbi:MAG: SPOR domain-containing protein [Pseudomonadota bacterium]
MNKPPVKPNRRLVLLLILLAVVAAGAAGYMLFLSPLAGSSPSLEKTAALKDSQAQTPIQPKLNQKISLAGNDAAGKTGEAAPSISASAPPPPGPESTAIPTPQPVINPADVPPPAGPGEKAAVSEGPSAGVVADMTATFGRDQATATPPPSDQVIPSEPQAPASASAQGAAGSQGEAVTETKPASEPPQVQPPAVTPPVASAPSSAPGTRKSSRAKPSAKSTWVINALSTKNQEEAKHYFQLLSQSSYRVYTYMVNLKGENWHRLRLGFFSSQKAAREVGAALAKQYKLPPPWIVQPGPEELKQYQTK